MQRNPLRAARSKGEQGEGSHCHLFEIKERRICGTSLPSEKQDLALADLRCVAANAAPTVTEKILPLLLQWRGRPPPHAVKLSIFPLGWEGNQESKRQFTVACLIQPCYQEPASPAPPPVSGYSCRGKQPQLLLLRPTQIWARFIISL